MKVESQSNLILGELKDKWKTLHNTPAVFAYKLNVTKKKFLEGEYKIYVEFNPERSRLRRLPQSISSLNTQFDDEAFNFKKISPSELIMIIVYEGKEISLIVNRSPLTEYHTLICPDVAGGHAQRINLIALKFAVEFLRNIEENSLRIGYNSPGALASVNHLHLHLVDIKANLYIDNAELNLLAESYIYRLNEDLPSEGICFLLDKNDNDKLIDFKVDKMLNFLIWLCEENIPHNLFITHDRTGRAGTLKVFIFAREVYCIVKDILTVNIGFCELAGFFPIGDETTFNSFTEDQAFSKIQEETGTVYNKIYKYFQ